MLNNIRYILFASVLFFFYSCGSEYSKIIKNDNSLIFYQSGQIKKEIILNNKNQIIEIKNFNDGKIFSEWFANDLDLIDSVEYYGNGQIKVQGYLKDGNKHSVWSYFDRQGHLLIERYFSYGKPSNIWIWYDHHEHNHIENFEIYEDFRDNGQLIRFYQSGNTKEIKNYSDNQLHGQYKLFNNDIDNSIQFETDYHLGKRK